MSGLTLRYLGGSLALACFLHLLDGFELLCGCHDGLNVFDGGKFYRSLSGSKVLTECRYCKLVVDDKFVQ